MVGITPASSPFFQQNFGGIIDSIACSVADVILSKTLLRSIFDSLLDFPPSLLLLEAGVLLVFEVEAGVLLVFEVEAGVLIEFLNAFEVEVGVLLEFLLVFEGEAGVLLELLLAFDVEAAVLLEFLLALS